MTTFYMLFISNVPKAGAWHCRFFCYHVFWLIKTLNKLVRTSSHTKGKLSLDIILEQSIFMLHSVLDQLLELFHLNFDNDLVYIFILICWYSWHPKVIGCQRPKKRLEWQIIRPLALFSIKKHQQLIRDKTLQLVKSASFKVSLLHLEHLCQRF